MYLLLDVQAAGFPMQALVRHCNFPYVRERDAVCRGLFLRLAAALFTYAEGFGRMQAYD